MTGRTFVIGDVHGDLVHLEALFAILPTFEANDTVVFLGDYLDRGSRSAEVVEFIRSRLPARTDAKIVALRGSHEDAWLKVRRQGWIEFILPVGNGCLATLRSFRKGRPPTENELATPEEFTAMAAGTFFPDDVVEWMESLPIFYEDEHAIYVHAGLPRIGERWAHPSELSDPKPLFWQRTEEFFRSYRGKRVVFGHTVVEQLPQQLSLYTPSDVADAFFSADLVGIDTCCGHGGFLTAVELPDLIVYESRKALSG
jgi:serine/threonine protein phosphatase 1